MKRWRSRIPLLLFFAAVASVFVIFEIQRTSHNQWMRHWARCYKVAAVVCQYQLDGMSGDLTTELRDLAGERALEESAVDSSAWFIEVRVFDESSNLAEVVAVCPTNRSSLFIQGGEILDDISSLDSARTTASKKPIKTIRLTYD